MPLFQYKAVSPGGEVQEGVLEGATQAGVIEHLRATGLIPIRANEVVTGQGAPAVATDGKKRPLFSRNGVNAADMALLTRELATLLKAGLPLDRSLEILIGLAEKPGVLSLLSAIRNDVRGGSSLSKALDQHREVFSRFYINMVKAGEVGGSLGGVLMRLADYLERAKELKDSVISALIYPAILFLTAMGSLAILLTVVVPQFKQIFDQSGAALSPATQALLATSIFLRGNWMLIAAAIMIAGWLLSSSFTEPASRIRWDRRLLSWPIAGGLIARIEMARFSRSLATLLQNGVPLLTGLSILKETLGNAVFRDAVDAVARELKEGRGMAKPMLETRVFPKLAVQMIAVGEETGRLDEMLFQVAELYDREVGAAVKRALAMLQPFMIIGLAIFIGVIMYLILDPMLGMMNLPS
jgi:general secretion pathway protein F